MTIKSAVVVMICLIFLLEANVTFLNHRSGEWYPVKVQNQESRSYILTTEQGCTISHNHIDIRPTNVF